VKNIVEISIAAGEGRDFGVSRRARSGRRQPQKLQHSGPKGKRTDCTRRRRVKAKLREDRQMTVGPNDVWAMDFVHDQLAT